jgi:recombination protein RecT
MEKNTQIQKTEITHAERFTATVVKHFNSGLATQLELTLRQKRLIQNYFIATDMALKTAEISRAKKRDGDAVPVTWQNVNMDQLAINVVACSRIGFDPAVKNHINVIPYKNNNTGRYDITFMEGYVGIELKARKYGYDVPDHVVIEVVYSNDIFKVQKKDKDHNTESYEFIVKSPFDRGTIIGGFYYFEYEKQSWKNRVVAMNIKQIEKRKPKYASAEFWGGEKDVWVDKKKQGTVTIDGWFDEMVYKTLCRAAYNSISIDSEKIDDDLMEMLKTEREMENATDPQRIIDLNSNTQEVDFEEVPKTQSKLNEQEVKATEPEQEKEPEPEKPGF